MNRQQHIDELERQRIAIARDIERVAARAREARSGIAAQARATTQRVRDDAMNAVRGVAGDARQAASRAASETGGIAREKVREATHRAADAVDPRNAVRQQPLIGLAAGVGLGVGLAMLLVPRRRHVQYFVRDDADLAATPAGPAGTPRRRSTDLPP